jgi:hypothetical protein
MVCFSCHKVFGSGTEYFEPQAFQFNHSHSKWAELLEKVIIPDSQSGQNRLDLASLKRNRKLLDAYIESLESVALTEFNDFSKNEQTAFLVNAFNAFLLTANLNDSLGAARTLDLSTKITIFSDSFSVSDFTTKFLKRKLSDPRAFLALICFDRGCPSPHRKALVPENLEVQLIELISRFMSDKSKNYFDRASNRIFLSPLFKKYESEFAKKYGSLRAFAGAYFILQPGLSRTGRMGTRKIEFMRN